MHTTTQSKTIVVDIDRFILVIAGDALRLYNNGEMVAEASGISMVDDIGHMAHEWSEEGRLRVGYTDYGDFEVIAVYDAGDEYGFGYHWNITDHSLSGWGDSALPVGDESLADYVARERLYLDQMKAVMGDSFIQGSPIPVTRIVATPVRP